MQIKSIWQSSVSIHETTLNKPRTERNFLNLIKGIYKKYIDAKFFFFNLFIIIIIFYFTILYWFCHTSTCICTGVHVFPILNPTPTSLPMPSLWVIPVHQLQASCILHRTWTGDSFLIWYYICFNAILPKHPPTKESKRLFYTSVSLLLSCI